uniref:Tubulin--tyrosine ligase-like protein 5 n=1 Tax=Phaeocystis antarctica TaxID=33657 RepID=A0A7S0HSH5_9EUKA|mmetsp:Transcript_30649/g.72299  ORF Transcript_30649/g.72299 Transcript_30649/m.72299 type:complete len:417 (+) Transcript_30649:80-1330(+)
MSDLYSQAGDQWIGMALQQRHMGTTEQALQAYDGAFKRFAETAHSVPLHQEMRKSYTDLSECPPVDTTVATKLKAQRAFSAGMSVYSWHAQTFLLPADFQQFERTYKARPRTRWLTKEPQHNRGEGVRMLNSLEEIRPGVGGPAPAILVQQYIGPPLLVDGFKFHYRYYALLDNPPALQGQPRKGLALFVFPRAPLRFSTARYSTDAEGWAQKNAHVTNSDANKNAVTDYCDINPWQHRTLHGGLEYAARTEPAKAAMLASRKVVGSSYRVLSRAFGKAARMWDRPLPSMPDGVQLERSDEAEYCHAVYGVDLALDDQANVWLVEIQIKPQMDCSCPQDEKVKDGMLVAMLRHDERILSEGVLPPQLEDMDTLAAAAELEVAKPEGEAELVRLPLVQYDEDEARDTARRFNHTYTF